MPVDQGPEQDAARKQNERARLLRRLKGTLDALEAMGIAAPAALRHLTRDLPDNGDEDPFDNLPL